ncbi:nucleotidyltransferase family protein [Ornithinimicrobium panacihumi]|uniref:nucleotidyltransferase family protein n=1 Tax=Ornithinimicrobium panacihumi TaxID=2008449 RepID=UPI003F8AA1FC
MEANGAPEVDLAVRVEFCHAALQHLARRHGLDVLHVKGMAFAPEWRSRGTGSDADVLVRPSHVKRFIKALEEGPWERRSRFHTGSPFGHAQTYWHPHFGYADVHRFFPGLGRDETTFDRLWVDREDVQLASFTCPVPSLTAQALIFAVNEARNSAQSAPSPRVEELRASDRGREVAAIVSSLGAEVGWAAALGQLDRFTEHREHDLWWAVTHDAGRVEEWRARIKAAPTVVAKAVLIARAPLVNTDHLANIRGHRPSPREVAREFVRRGRQAAVEMARSRKARR